MGKKLNQNEFLKKVKMFLLGQKDAYPLMDISSKDILEIAQRRFPEYKSYEKTFVNGRFVCINSNALHRAIIKVEHNNKNNQTVLSVIDSVTVLGGLLVGLLWTTIAYGSFTNEVREVYIKEFAKRAEQMNDIEVVPV